MSHKFFLVDLSYVRPLKEVDEHLDAHVQFLNDQYAQQHFIFSGPKEPREGGIILARMKNREALDQVLSCDPFNKAGLARYSVTQFIPRMYADTFKAVLEDA
ncbi:MAG: YciI family protein [Magnetovibrio sp.]|nr:YciI family protein [Magnetovibrio sp.]